MKPNCARNLLLFARTPVRRQNHAFCWGMRKPLLGHRGRELRPIRSDGPNLRLARIMITPVSHMAVKSESQNRSMSTTETKRGSTVSSWLASYERFIGVKDVKDAQENVTRAETEFLVTRQHVSSSRHNLEDIQSELQASRTRLDRTPRDDPKFLVHATEEHKLIQTEKRAKEEHHRLLDEEREMFDRLSVSVRESHGKQKAQEEKTKYWSIIGSVVGTVIGIVGSTFISHRRTRDLKGMVNDVKEQILHLDGGAGEELKMLLADMKTASAESGSVKHDDETFSKLILCKTGEQLKAQEEVIHQLLKEHESSFHEEMRGIRRAVSLGSPGDASTLEELIENAEQKLEWEVKMGTLATVVFVYGAFAMMVPLLYSIFK